MAEKTYYWLKMPKGFLDKHYMKIIRGKDPNGIDLCLFYIWMLTESVDHAAELRYSDKTPYDAELLSDASGFSQEIVQEGLQLFEKLELIDISDNGTIFMVKGNEMIGSETAAAARMRKYRKRNNVTECSDMSQNSYEHIEKDKEIDTDKESTKESSLVTDNDPDFEKAWRNTFALYPNKSAAVMAKQRWMEKLVNVIEPNRKEVARLIYKATKMYLTDYEERNPDDESFHYLPKYSTWLEEDCDYWISQYEESQKEKVT